MIEDTAGIVEETAAAAGETVQITKDTVGQIPKVAPNTTKSIKKGARIAKKKSKAAAGKVENITKREVAKANAWLRKFKRTGLVKSQQAQKKSKVKVKKSVTKKKEI
jgi:predicted RecA/RadA family phage recombinase